MNERRVSKDWNQRLSIFLLKIVTVKPNNHYCYKWVWDIVDRREEFSVQEQMYVRANKNNLFMVLYLDIKYTSIRRKLVGKNVVYNIINSLTLAAQMKNKIKI